MTQSQRTFQSMGHLSWLPTSRQRKNYIIGGKLRIDVENFFAGLSTRSYFPALLTTSETSPTYIGTLCNYYLISSKPYFQKDNYSYSTGSTSTIYKFFLAFLFQLIYSPHHSCLKILHLLYSNNIRKEEVYWKEHIRKHPVVVVQVQLIRQIVHNDFQSTQTPMSRLMARLHFISNLKSALASSIPGELHLDIQLICNTSP